MLKNARDDTRARSNSSNGRSPEAYEAALCNVYKDLFGFFCTVGKIFIKSNGSKESAKLREGD
jgi:hypothetical protein